MTILMFSANWLYFPSVHHNHLKEQYQQQREEDFMCRMLENMVWLPIQEGRSNLTYLRFEVSTLETFIKKLGSTSTLLATLSIIAIQTHFIVQEMLPRQAQKL